MRKIIAIGLIFVLVALSACTSYDNRTNSGDTNDQQSTVSVGVPVLDTIADTPEEAVDSQELDAMMDNISMDDW